MASAAIETGIREYLTTTGVGHPHPGPPLPDNSLKEWRCLQPIPPGLRPGFSNQPVTIGDLYTTTFKHAYRPRALTTPPCPIHKRAPGNWKVHYTMHTIEKCRAREWCPPLTMGNQSSEMKSQYQGKPDQILPRLPDTAHDQPLPHTLRDHINDQLTKDLPPSTVNQSARGRPLIPADKAVLDRLEPYLTTKQCYHRSFTDKELTCYPRNDIATYWQCENYPKAWGYGLNYNPLDREEDNKLHSCSDGPMRDRMLLSKPTKLPQLPMKSAKPVSRGLQSLYCASYANPPPGTSRKLFHCPVPPFPAVTKDTTQLECVPHMYQPTNSIYGNPPLPPQERNEQLVDI